MGCCGSKEPRDWKLTPEEQAAKRAAQLKRLDAQLQRLASLPQVTLTPEEQAAKRAVQAAKRAALLKRLAALPKHLRLGVTLAGMRELLKQLPSDALQQVNAKIPLDKETGKPKFPENDEENGYVN
eukprot:scaffold60881_cov21-Phaeocystis_antarctica.AAC.1